MTIKELVNVIDIEELLKLYGITNFTLNNNNIRCKCILHNDADNPTSFSINKDTKKYKCFSCGASGDIFQLVSIKENCNFFCAVEFLRKFANVDNIEINQTNEDYLDIIKYIRDHKNKVKKVEQNINYNELINEYAKNYNHPSILNRCNDKELLKLSKIGFCKEGKYANCTIFPYYDDNNILRGFKARDKRRFLTENICGISDTFFMINHAIHCFSSFDNTALIVEGEWDCLTLWHAGFANSIAIGGLSFNNERKTLLGKYVTNIVLGLDQDNAGIKRVKELIEELKNWFDISVLVFDKKDADEVKNKEDLLVIYNNRISYKKWLNLLGDNV